ncbi:MAG: hypothetical protein ABW169_13895 [Sphingobium sp.]
MTDRADIKPKPSSDTDLEGQEKPLDLEEKLEAGLEESMDGSDPLAVTAPGDHGNPVPSSGFPDGEKDAKSKP